MIYHPRDVFSNAGALMSSDDRDGLPSFNALSDQFHAPLGANFNQSKARPGRLRAPSKNAFPDLCASKKPRQMSAAPERKTAELDHLFGSETI